MSRESDLITIGATVCDLLNIEGNFKDIGEDFLNHFGMKLDDSTAHTTMKLVRHGHYNMAIIRYALSRTDLSLTKYIPIRIKNAEVKAKLVHNVYRNPIPDDVSGYIHDFSRYCKNFVIMDGLESWEKGAGETVLLSALQAVRSAPAIIEAGYLYAGDYFTGNRSKIDRLVKYYETLGFENVNDNIGQCSNSVVMLKSNGVLSDFCKLPDEEQVQFLKECNNLKLCPYQELSKRAGYIVGDWYNIYRE